MIDPVEATAEELIRVQREASSRLLAALVRRFGDLALAEDVAQDAMAAALETWPRTGIPASPLAWLLTTARRRAIDIVRRDAMAARRLAELRLEEERRSPAAPVADDGIPDDRLQLLFACCHPTLRQDEQIALTLRYLGGLSTQEVAAAFLVPVTTMQARLTRAKKRITVTRIPIRVPGAAELPDRLPAVLHVIYLIYTEGYAATAADVHVRSELTAEAIRLARITANLLPGESEVDGLLALLLLTEARAPARTDGEGLPIALEDQDRTLWLRPLLEEGIALAQQASGQGGISPAGLGPHVVQAAIAAVHAEAASFDDTDWGQVVVLYDLLRRIVPGPVVELNRAIAVGQLDGFQVGLRLLDRLGDSQEMQRYHPYHAARAVTLEGLERYPEAAAAWRAAGACTASPPEGAYITRRLTRLGRRPLPE